MSTVDVRQKWLKQEIATGSSTLGELSPGSMLKHFVLNSYTFTGILTDAVEIETIPSKQQIADAFKTYAMAVLGKAQEALSLWLPICPDARRLSDSKALKFVDACDRAVESYEQFRDETKKAFGLSEKVLQNSPEGNDLYARAVYEILSYRLGLTSGKEAGLSPVSAVKLLPHLPPAMRAKQPTQIPRQ